MWLLGFARLVTQPPPPPMSMSTKATEAREQAQVSESGDDAISYIARKQRTLPVVMVKPQQRMEIDNKAMIERLTALCHSTCLPNHIVRSLLPNCQQRLTPEQFIDKA